MVYGISNIGKGSIGAPFDPSSISGLRLLHDSSRIAGSDGDAIGTTSDLSGNGNHGIQATASKKPLLKIGVYNGLSCLRLDGVDDCLQVASMSINTFMTIFVVGKFTTAGFLLIEHSANANSNDGFYFVGTNGNAWQVRRSASSHFGPGTASWMGSALSIAEFVYDGSGLYLLNGSVQSNGTVGGTARSNSSVTAALNIGSRNQASIFAAGDLCEMVIYDGAKSVAERSAFRSYAGRKWGITVS